MMPSGPLRVMPPDSRWIDALNRRKAIVETMCGALRDYLCIDIEEALSRAENAPTWKPTMADLEAAQRDKETIQKQIDALERLCDTLPEENAELIKAVQMPMLQTQLKTADQMLSMIQTALESAQ